jgi:hypothetical protein
MPGRNTYRRADSLSKSVSKVAYDERYQTLAAAGIINATIVLCSGCSIIGVLQNCNLIAVFFGAWYYPSSKFRIAPFVSRFSEVWNTLHLASRLAVLLVVAAVGWNSWHVRCIFSSFLSSRALLEFRYPSLDAYFNLSKVHIVQSSEMETEMSEREGDDSTHSSRVTANESDKDYDHRRTYDKSKDFNDLRSADIPSDPKYFEKLRQQLKQQSQSASNAADGKNRAASFDEDEDFGIAVKPSAAFSPRVTITRSSEARARPHREGVPLSREPAPTTRKSPKSGSRGAIPSRPPPVADVTESLDSPIFPQLSKVVQKARR